MNIHKLDTNNIEDIIYLTTMQQDMLFSYLNKSNQKCYIEQLCLNISGYMNEDIIKKAWEVVVESNEILRTVYRWEKLDSPIQIVLKKYETPIRKHDLSFLDSNKQNERLRIIKYEDRDENLDISTNPLRITLCKLSGSVYEMILTYHHILFDGWSNGIILREFFQSYNCMCNGTEIVRSGKSKYKQFVKWLYNMNYDDQKAYWKNYLKDFNIKSYLPVNSVREVGKDQYSSYKQILSKKLFNQVKEFVRVNKITLASLLYCTWGILISKFCNQDDIVFGRVISGRNVGIESFDNTVGLFINTIPLRIVLKEKMPFLSLIKEINYSISEQLNYENMPIQEIKKYCGIDNKYDLFNTLVIIENYPIDTSISSFSNNIKLENYSFFEKIDFPLSLSISTLDNLELNFLFNMGLFESSTIRRITEYFINILEEILENPLLNISDIKMISEEEYSEIVLNFNNTITQYERNKTIHQLFEAVVNERPNDVALVFQGKELTFQEVNEKSNQLARILRKNCVVNDSIVAIISERSFEMVIGIIAILKAGGAYLHIDPKFPIERINQMLTDSSCNVLLAHTKILNAISFNGIIIDMNTSELIKQDISNLECNVSASNLAYMIYTSGSTGMPKGIMIEHNSVCNLIKGISDQINFTEASSILALTTMSFDISIIETILPLCCATKVYIADERLQSDPNCIIDYIKKNNIDMLQVTPSRAQMLICADIDLSCFRTLKTILIGGEAFKPDILEALRGISTLNIFNMYGPTETTVWSSIKKLNGENRVSIGKPIANTQMYVLDRNCKLQPMGVIGELCISGEGLARGYFNNPKLTKEKFINNPFISGKRLYRTGDLAKLCLDGNIEYVGRVDNQVKVRGYRIELGDIESHLSQNVDIKQAVVIDKTDDYGDVFLCAYYVSDKKLDISDIKNYLLTKVPEYMVPVYFEEIKEIPLLENGKVDRKKLPDPYINFDSRGEHISPRNAIEKSVVDIWIEVLQVEKISINDDFFNLGGDSIKAMKIVSKLQKFGYIVNIGDVFTFSTVEKLSNHLVKGDNSVEIISSLDSTNSQNCGVSTNRYELTTMQLGILFHTLIGKQKNAYCEQFALKVIGEIAIEDIEESLNRLIMRHEILRTKFQYEKLIRPEQVVLSERKLKVDFHDISMLEENEKMKFVEEYKRNDINMGFSITNDVLIRAAVIKIHDYKYIIIFTYHHIVMDGWSTNIVIDEFYQIYHSIKYNKTLKLKKAIPFHYYVDWLNKQNEKEAELFWKKYLQDYNSKVPFETYKKNSNTDECILKDMYFEINTIVVNELIKVSKSNRVTINALFQAIWATIIHKYSGFKDILFGSVISGRFSSIKDVENIVGVLINTIPVRIKLDSNITFRQVMKDIQCNFIESEKYGYYSLPNIQKTSKVVLDNIYLFQNYPNDGGKLLKETNDFTIEDVKVAGQSGNNLNIIIIPMDTYKVQIKYNCCVYNEKFIEKLLFDFEKVINLIICNDDIAVEMLL